MSRKSRVQAMIATGDKGECKGCSFASAVKVRGTGEHLWYCYNMDVLRPLRFLDNGAPSGCSGGFLNKPKRLEDVIPINGDPFVLKESAVEYELGISLDSDPPKIWKLKER